MLTLFPTYRYFLQQSLLEGRRAIVLRASVLENCLRFANKARGLRFEDPRLDVGRHAELANLNIGAIKIVSEGECTNLVHTLDVVRDRLIPCVDVLVAGHVRWDEGRLRHL